MPIFFAALRSAIISACAVGSLSQIVLSVDVDGDPVMRSEYGNEVASYKSNFELVDSNPMPELVAGMVVELSGYIGDNLKALYIHDKLALYLGKGTSCNPSHNAFPVERVWGVVVHKGINRIDGYLGEPIWTKTPAKTEQEIKRDTLIEKAEEMKAKADEMIAEAKAL